MMASSLRAAFLVVLCCGTTVGEESTPAVAVVSGLVGTASVTRPPAPGTEPLRLFAWISAGSVVEVAPRSRVTLVFASGTRYELGETATGTVGLRALASSSGPVRVLAPLPPLPRLAPIAEGARAGPRSGAVRIRGAAIASLYPDGGAASLADSTVLRFAPIPDASRYRVEIETESGATVFQVETQSPIVAVSPGILKPGSTYYWQVRTLDRVGQVARGAAGFVTLGEETARARAAIKASLAGAGDAASLALMAEIDRGLGLLVEACDQLRAALAKSPGDSALLEALERLEQRPALKRRPSAHQ